MKKVVINTCFGGFGLSREAMFRYAEIKGITLYPEEDKQYASLGIITYYTVPEDKRTPPLPEPWNANTIEECCAYNKACAEETLSPYSIARDDPALVQVVKELGSAANGGHAKLRVVEIPDDVNWEIEEYDGNEHVAEVHRMWR